MKQCRFFVCQMSVCMGNLLRRKNRILFLFRTRKQHIKGAECEFPVGLEDSGSLFNESDQLIVGETVDVGMAAELFFEHVEFTHVVHVVRPDHGNEDSHHCFRKTTLIRESLPFLAVFFSSDGRGFL